MARTHNYLNDVGPIYDGRTRRYRPRRPNEARFARLIGLTGARFARTTFHERRIADEL